jgi:negative regulator of flagellin synthesis FlgM
MVSDIKGFNSRQTNGPRESEAGVVRADARAAARSQGTAGSRDDTVALSGVAEVIKTTAAALAAEPAVNEARVQEIKTAVERGDYSIDPDRIARKLIEADSQY